MFKIELLKSWLRELVDQIDEQQIHPNDYAIMVSGLPKNAVIEQEIKEFFEKNSNFIKHRFFSKSQKKLSAAKYVAPGASRTLQKLSRSSCNASQSISRKIEIS